MARDEIDPAYTTRALMVRFWRDYLWRHTGWIAVAFLLMTIEGGSLGVVSYTLKPMFDHVFVGGNADMLWLVAAGDPRPLS